jgi:DNA-3-methyladenine glycosylase
MPESRTSAKLQKPQGATVTKLENISLRNRLPVPPEFYARDPRRVAPELLGKVLTRRDGRKLRAGRIVEVEAYLGTDDPAAHASAGRTKRNDVLFGPPGRAYVYFIYGFHHCLNVSCELEGQAGCVLIRALEPLLGISEMYAARDLEQSHGRIAELRLLTSGPGRLAEALSITRQRDNGKDLSSPRSDLQIVNDGFAHDEIALTPRIGIKKAEHKLLRYLIAGNTFVSGKKIPARS